MQHDLLALMQQNTEHGAENEDRGVGNVAAGFELELDLAALAQHEPRDAGNPQQELFAGDLPGGTRLAGIVQRRRNRTPRG
ncbi:MAG: hypothetical protein WDN48_20865 [Pseudolabrys sp.]